MLVSSSSRPVSFFFFFNDTATTEIYTLSLHDALPIYEQAGAATRTSGRPPMDEASRPSSCRWRSEEHTSELQSLAYLVCRLLLEKKKKNQAHTLVQHPPPISPIIAVQHTVSSRSVHMP